MARDTLTGSRIRERRLMSGLRQADLARKVGISASYLNLIEHNRRRIGGKLLVEIARVLGVEPSMLSEGAEAALIATLREAAVDAGVAHVESDRADELAGRFPGWAETLVWAQRRIASLERTVETLSDRLNHDPQLAGSLHEVLSTAAAIRSTASILAEPGEIAPEWRDRFHRNLNEDSLRLAESSKALVRYLDESDTTEDLRGVPQEEAENFFAAHDHLFPQIEKGTADLSHMLREAPELGSDAARRVARAELEIYARDAAQMPMKRFETALREQGVKPISLARTFGVDLPAVFRRISVLAGRALGLETGLVVCDASGSILFRKQVTGFALPRHGESCPLWPLFTALNRPLMPIRRQVSQLGRSTARFDCFAVAWPEQMPDFERDPLYRSVMLILPLGETASDLPSLSEDDVQPVGSSCRICPRHLCAARREPSILSDRA